MYWQTFILITVSLVAQGYADAVSDQLEAAKKEFEAMKTEALARLDKIKAAVEDIEKKRNDRIKANDKIISEVFPSYNMFIDETKSPMFKCEIKARAALSLKKRIYDDDYKFCIKKAARDINQDQRDANDVFTKMVITFNYYIIKCKQCKTTKCHNENNTDGKDDIGIRNQKFNELADVIIATAAGIDATFDKCNIDNDAMIKELDKIITDREECINY